MFGAHRTRITYFYKYNTQQPYCGEPNHFMRVLCRHFLVTQTLSSNISFHRAPNDRPTWTPKGNMVHKHGIPCHRVAKRSKFTKHKVSANVHISHQHYNMVSPVTKGT